MSIGTSHAAEPSDARSRPLSSSRVLVAEARGRGSRVPKRLESQSATEWFRHVLGEYPTGVTVATALDHLGRPIGMTVGSFTSVSLEPQLVAFMANRMSSTWREIAKVGVFCVNVLSADQEALGRAFAGHRPRFRDAKWRSAESGSPILEGIVAWIDCALEAVHVAGDHDIAVGRVRELRVETNSEPLLFHRGGYGHFEPTSSPA